MFLRSYEGDVSDLCLTFSMTDSELGQVREVDLVPGGSSIAVTNENQQEAFLRFCDSVQAGTPLLGFKYLEPQLCVQLAGSMLDDSSAERLPTASTCMNLLKLPPYKTREAMREKLLYAIMSGAGFDLS
eukprot:jgi/Tetstr1/422411/TSEL_013249.t1